MNLVKIFPLFFSGLAVAATPIDGWYSQVLGGYTFMPSSQIRLTNNQTLELPQYVDGYHAGGAIGFKSNPLRYEGEINYIHASDSKINLNFFPNQSIAKGHTEALLVMANAYYDFPEILPSIQPFLGLGLGYARIESEVNTHSLNVTVLPFSAADNALAYQALAGLTYNFAENYSLSLGYTYVASDKLDYSGHIFQAHLATLTASYRFNQNNYK